MFTGVIHAKINNGAADKPNSHLQPSVGAIAKANATSKQAPRAQKHCKHLVNGNYFICSMTFYKFVYLHRVKLRT